MIAINLPSVITIASEFDLMLTIDKHIVKEGATYYEMMIRFDSREL
jgi:hypothetical protein